MQMLRKLLLTCWAPTLGWLQKNQETQPHKANKAEFYCKNKCVESWVYRIGFSLSTQFLFIIHWRGVTFFHYSFSVQSFKFKFCLCKGLHAPLSCLQEIKVLLTPSQEFHKEFPLIHFSKILLSTSMENLFHQWKKKKKKDTFVSLRLFFPIKVEILR